MGNTSEMKTQKQINVAVLAHVDAGKTTLSEAMLYLTGSIRKAGRVDNRDAFFDTNHLERDRGITIFSKQAELTVEDMRVTLLDTPGHVDFSAEMERVLTVLDYAILVVSGANGVQGHTRTLWNLLKKYRIPVFLFVNKMDQPGADKEELLAEIRQKLSADCMDFTEDTTEAFYENAATCEEAVLEQYLENGWIAEEEIARLVGERKLFPCYFGSALKMEGVQEFLTGFYRYTLQKEYPSDFGARVFKIARDEQGKRLTYLKVTGGALKVRQVLSGAKKGENGQTEGGWEEKVNQIRIYSGEMYVTAERRCAGGICAVTGLSETYPGQGLGGEADEETPVLEPVLTYCIGLPEGMDAARALPLLRQLQEEEPELSIVWKEELQELSVRLMGDVQMEILKSLIWERFGFEVTFGNGSIVYKETIADRVEGVGHFEPLRHYAEVHLLLEPADPGSGMQFAADCSEDVLDRNWQRLILTHLEEKQHVGVLTGSALADVKITLKSGRAHPKHTEGGDFRKATYRAVRQGLMQAESVLLEPYFHFVLEVPEDAVGRAMTDVERMHGKVYYDAAQGTKELRVLTGRAPVSEIQDYQKEVIAYTRGHGSLTFAPGGYEPCHNAKEVIEAIGYEAERDVRNTADSVFCAHGAGFIVPWNEVAEHMHLESILTERLPNEEAWELARAYKEAAFRQRARKAGGEEAWIGTDEIDKILAQTYDANRRGRQGAAKNHYKLKRTGAGQAAVTRTYKPQAKLEEYLLVDGYNVIFAWEELGALAAENIDGARGRLLDILCNYQGMQGCQVIAVFDAYRVKGHKTEIFDYHNIHVVYTREAETADAYIEKFAHENSNKYHITVATSDGLEQIIIRGAGCDLLSARELKQRIEQGEKSLKEQYHAVSKTGRNFMMDGIDLSKLELGKEEG